MKYLLLLITVWFLPVSLFAQMHHCNDDATSISKSILHSINVQILKNAASAIIEKMPTRNTYSYTPRGCYSNCNTYHIGNPYISSARGINLPYSFSTSEYYMKKIPNRGTSASKGNLEIDHRRTVATTAILFRRPTPYGYYPSY